jgi:hypothetical protein
MKKMMIVLGILAIGSLGLLAQSDAENTPQTAPAKKRATAPGAPPSAPAAAPLAPSTPPSAPIGRPSSPTAPAAPAARPAPPSPVNPPASFEQIKSLLGEWQGKLPDGKVANVSYKLISSGTAVMETMNPNDSADMITVYYPDGDRLMLTHYCASNNQPRMRTDAVSADPKQLVFNYVDATNLGGSREGVMTGLTVTFVDPDHFSQTWTWRDKVGGTATSETFQYTRKK